MKTAALNLVTGVPTDDLTLVALILAARCGSHEQIMESGSGSGGGGGGGVMDVESSDAL